MPRANHKINYGDTVTLLASEGEKTVCRVSFDDLPAELRACYGEGFAPMQWVVLCRPLPCQYPAAGTDIVNVMLRIISGHGGMSIKRDVDGTVITKAGVTGSFVEVRARFVDVNGVTVAPSDAAFKGVTQKVNVAITPGTDSEVEPQLWWTPALPAGLSLDANTKKLPNASALLTQQKLRRVRSTLSAGAGLFFQTFDSVNAPVNGASPITSDPQPVLPNVLDIDWGPQGHVYTKGLWTAISSTEFTLTLAAGAATRNIQAQLYRLDSGDGTA